MKTKKIIKILNIIFIIIVIFTCFSSIALAWSPDWDKVENPTTQPVEAQNDIYKVMGAAIYILRIIGTGVALIMLIWLGITYVSTPYTEKKAEIKKQAPTYITGATIIFAASEILHIIQKFVESNVNA